MKHRSPGTAPIFRMCAIFIALSSLSVPWEAVSGSFTPMTTALPSSFSPGHMLLLPDGRVMVQDSGGVAWEFLLPDYQGHYIDGTWSNCPSMNLARLYYSSDVLTDGRVFVAGGEYNPDGKFGLPDGATAELFDPMTNNGAGAWSFINPPNTLLNSNVEAFWDSESVLLPGGSVLVAPNNLASTLIYNPFSNTWSAVGATASGSQDEASWVKLPDDSILTIDPYGTDCQRYIPSLNTWIRDSPVPVDLYSTNHEIGASLLLSNDTVLYIGGNNSSEIYTPSPAGGTNPGSWSAGPNIPDGLVMRDAPACVLNNGKLLLTFVPPTNDTPMYIYEYDVSTGSFTNVFTDTFSISDETSMLQLPDGNVLFNDTGTMYVYQPDPSPITAGKPAVQSLSYDANGSLHLTGTLFNGISQGAMFGDDAQQDSNYPLVRFVDGSGDVYYGRSYNWSSTGVMTGSKVVSTEVVVPPEVLDSFGSYSLEVVANGNPSAPFSYQGPVWVNFSAFGYQDGSESYPFSTLAAGVSAVTAGGAIYVEPGSSSETLTISKPMTIVAFGGPATIGLQ